MEYDKFVCGSFTSTGAATPITLPFVPDWVEVFNYTKLTTPADGDYLGAFWQNGMPQDSAIVKTALQADDGIGTVVVDSSAVDTTGGISTFEAGIPVFGPVLTGSAVSQAGSAVVTVSSTTSLQTGDVVLIYATTGMLQIASQAYQITVLNGTTFSIPVSSSGFAAAATNVRVKKVLYPDLYLPQSLFITAINTSTSLVSCSRPHNYVIGQLVRLHIPAAWGSVELDGIQAYVTAVNSATTFTLDYDMSAATAFAFPVSAVAAAGVSFPQASAIGDNNTGAATAGGLVIEGAFYNNTRQGFILGSSVCGAASDVLYWKAQAYARVQND